MKTLHDADPALSGTIISSLPSMPITFAFYVIGLNLLLTLTSAGGEITFTCCEGSDCILVYGTTTKGDVVKRSDCILVYGNTTKGDVIKRSDCILVYIGALYIKGDVVKRSDCILVYGSTTKAML